MLLTLFLLSCSLLCSISQATVTPITGFVERLSDPDNLNYINGYVVGTYASGTNLSDTQTVYASFTPDLSSQVTTFDSLSGLWNVVHNPSNTLAIFSSGDGYSACNGTHVFDMPSSIQWLTVSHWITDELAYVTEYPSAYMIDFSDLENIATLTPNYPADASCDYNVVWNDSLIVGCYNTSTYSSILGKINSAGNFETISVTGTYTYYNLMSAGNYLISSDYSGNQVRIDSGDLNFKPIYNTATGGSVDLTAGSPCSSTFALVYESAYGWGSVSYSTGNYTSFGLGLDPTFIQLKANSPALEGSTKCILPLFSQESYSLKTAFTSVIFREFPSGTILSGQTVERYSDDPLSFKVGSGSFTVWPTTTEGLEGVAFDGTTATVIDVISGYASASPFNCQKASATTVFCAARTSLNSTGIVYYNVSSGSFTAHNFTLDPHTFIDTDEFSYIDGTPYFLSSFDFDDGTGTSMVFTSLDSNTSTVSKMSTPQTSYLSSDVSRDLAVVSYPDGIITHYPFKNSGLELAFINSTGAYMLFESAPGLATIPYMWASFDNHAIVFATSLSYNSYNVTFVDEYGSVNAPITVTGLAGDAKGQCDFAVYVTSTEIGTIHKNGSSYAQSGNFTITNFVGFCKDGDFYALGTKELVTGLIRVSPDATTTLNSKIPDFAYESIEFNDGKYYFIPSYFVYTGPPKYLVNPATDAFSSVDFYGTTPTSDFILCGSSNPSYSWATDDYSRFGRYKNDPSGDIRTSGRAFFSAFCGPDDRFYNSYFLDSTLQTYDSRNQRDFGLLSTIPDVTIQAVRGCMNSTCDSLFVMTMAASEREYTYSSFTGFSVAPPSFQSTNAEETSSSLSVFVSLVSLIMLILVV